MVSKSASMNIELDVVKVSEINPHERFDINRAEILKKRIFRDGFIDEPLIVDKELGMILDGTHRHYILSRAGIRYIPIIKVSYRDDDIKIGCWYRVYKDLDINVIRDIIIDHEGDLGKQDGRRIILYRGEAIQTLLLKDRVEVPDVIHHLDVINRDRLVKYIEKPINMNDHVIMGYDPPSKEYVIKRFRKKRLFPVKYTRHLVPIRVVNLRMPLKYLEDAKSAYNYIDHIILTPYRVKIYMEEGYEERYFIARRKY